MDHEQDGIWKRQVKILGETQRQNRWEKQIACKKRKEYFDVSYFQVRRQWRRPGVFIANFEYISNLFPVFLLLTFKK